MRRLLVVDQYDSPAFARLPEASGPADEWDVFVIGGSPDWMRWRYPAALAAVPVGRLVTPEPFCAQAHALVNEFVLRLGESLPRMSLGGLRLHDLLQGESGSDWWYLETSEKGPYRGPLIGQLYTLAMVSLVARAEPYGEVWHCVRESLLAKAFPDTWKAFGPPAPANDRRLERRPLLRLCYTSLRACLRLVSAWLFCLFLPKPSTRPAGRWVFTVFPSWWTRTDSPSPGDRFFTDVAAASFDGYLAWLTETRQLWRQRRAVRQAVVALKLQPLQQFLELRDLVSPFAPRRFWRVWQFQRVMRPALTLNLAGMEAGPLIGHEVARSLSAHDPVQNALLARCVRRMVRRIRPSLVLYRAEFQPIENALLRGLQGFAAGVGFQHHPFGENYLSMRFTDAEMAAALATPPAPGARPFPEGIVAIGPALAAHVVRGGIPESRVAVCGPQRYGGLIRYRRSQPSRETLRSRLGLPAAGLNVFVALAIVEADTEALFGALVAACDGLPDARIIVRTHPNRPQGDPALRATLGALGHERASLMPSDGSMYDYIAGADCMLCIGSMIAFEAMALGIMPIVFDNPATFGAVSLAEYGESLYVVRNAGELRRALDEVVVDAPAARARREQWPGMLAAVMGDFERPLGEQMDGALDRFDPAGDARSSRTGASGVSAP